AQTFWLAVECNLTLLAGTAPDRYYEFETASGASPDPELVGGRNLASRGALEALRAVTLVDEWARLRLRLASTLPFSCWRLPIETVGVAEGRRERSYRASAIYCHWQRTVAPGGHLPVPLALPATGW